MVEKALAELRSQVGLRSQYGNWIGGQWVAPVKGQNFDNPSPITGMPRTMDEPWQCPL